MPRLPERRPSATGHARAAFEKEISSTPYVNLQITRGATRRQKAEVVRRFTETLVDVLGKSPEHTHIVIQEIDEADWGFAGLLTDDKGARALQER